jgi:hypothetical protein
VPFEPTEQFVPDATESGLRYLVSTLHGCRY